jgi:hypothetical protein
MSPLTYGTTRAHMASKLHLVASVGAQLYGGNDQYRALMRRAAVSFTREQVQTLCPTDRRPPNVEAFSTWTLNADDTWTGS